MPALGSLGWDAMNPDHDRHISRVRRHGMPRLHVGHGGQALMGELIPGVGQMMGGPGDPVGEF